MSASSASLDLDLHLSDDHAAGAWSMNGTRRYVRVAAPCVIPGPPREALRSPLIREFNGDPRYGDGDVAVNCNGFFSIGVGTLVMKHDGAGNFTTGAAQRNAVTRDDVMPAT